MKKPLSQRNGHETKLVIFDLDGTLIDAYEPVARSLNYALQRVGVAPLSAETIKRTVGWGDRHLLRSCIGDIDLGKVVRIYRRHHARSLRNGSKLLPGARRLLNVLRRRNLKMAVASNRPTRFSHIVMEHLDIRSYFDYVLCGDKLPKAKPDPDILFRILKKFRLPPEQALYVGDMIIDIQTGHSAGVRTVAVATGSSHKSELRALKPFRLIDNVYEVARDVFA